MKCLLFHLDQLLLKLQKSLNKRVQIDLKVSFYSAMPLCIQMLKGSVFAVSCQGKIWKKKLIIVAW